MISFWVNPAGAFGMTNYLQDRGKKLADRIVVRNYDWQQRVGTRRGPQIFSALDQLTPSELDGVTALQTQLSSLAPQLVLLNHPNRSLTRYQLLQRLAETGLNSFRAYRAHQAESTLRFPVFVREDRGHGGSLTDLLGSARELQRALRALQLRGFGRQDLLIVEFCDTSDSSGIYRKYAAFRVGDAIIPAHLLSGKEWCIKHDTSETTAQRLEEEMVYLEQNPHDAWLRQVFTLAGIEYGRIDYGVLAGRPQAWEINTNPTIGRNPRTPRSTLPPELRALRTRTRDAYHERLLKAFEALGQEDEASPMELRLEASLVQRIVRETRRAARRERRLRILHNFYSGRWAAPVRALVRRYMPKPRHVNDRSSSSAR